MGKASKKKGGSGKKKKPITQEPFTPYVKDGINYSGLETLGMKKMSCSLMFPVARGVRPNVNVLKPQTVTLFRDRAFHSHNDQTHFSGATVLHLEVGATNKKVKQMPEIVTVAGKCRFTESCLKEFAIMMRTKEEAKLKGVPAGGALDWPDVRALLLCPVCGNMAPPNGKEVYWLLFYPLLQMTAQGNFGSRNVPRLCCHTCMESLLDGVECTKEGGEYTSMFQVLNEDTPPVAFLDAATNPILAQANLGTELDAWMLHLFWDNSGAFEANENVRKELLQQVFGGGNKWQPNPTGEPAGGQATLEINVGNRKKNSDDQEEDDSDESESKTCWTCAVELPPDDINLCSRCKRAVYCSRACQKDNWAEHKPNCRAPP